MIIMYVKVMYLIIGAIKSAFIRFLSNRQMSTFIKTCTLKKIITPHASIHTNCFSLTLFHTETYNLAYIYMYEKYIHEKYFARWVYSRATWKRKLRRRRSTMRTAIVSKALFTHQTAARSNVKLKSSLLLWWQCEKFKEKLFWKQKQSKI